MHSTGLKRQTKGAVRAWLPVVGLVALIVAVLGRMMFYTPPAVKDGSHAPEMVLSNPGEPVVHLSEKRGKVILLDFWATWCGPCKQSMPHLSKVYETWKDEGVEVYGISTDTEDRRKLVPEVAKELGVTYPLLYLLDQPDLSEKFSPTSLPTLVIINKKGEVVKYEQGYDPTFDLDATIGALVKEKG